ncbi:MAG TPA: type II toxin-antitoxin system HicB family antitoxin [Candidatus Kapabacteria bacterium]|nr:type II toxin-antitoxin system HicB family antitoxin [Candidatus Kapabacteria bacterium]HPO63228.1 type II toxin-antitoxin system HicB family antitoxin [Candidatus Kapabacteria bacterium]
MKYNNYKIMLRPEPEDGFTVIVPSLPGCITYGSTLKEAKQMAVEAIELYLESLVAHIE